MSENKRQSETDVVIDNKSQGSVATYLKCGGISNDHFTTNLLPCLLVEKIMNIWQSYIPEGGSSRPLCVSER